jgi:hypothetical protein
MRVRCNPGDTVPRNLPGRVILMRSNSLGAVYQEPSMVEWFDTSTIQADAWVVPDTANGFYYVFDDGKDA